MNELAPRWLTVRRLREGVRSLRSEPTGLLFARRFFRIGITSAGRRLSSVTVPVKSIAKRSPPMQKITRECRVLSSSGSGSGFGWRKRVGLVGIRTRLYLWSGFARWLSPRGPMKRRLRISERSELMGPGSVLSQTGSGTKNCRAQLPGPPSPSHRLFG